MAGIPRFDTTQELDLARPAQHNNPGQAKGDELATLRFLHTLVGNTQRRGDQNSQIQLYRYQFTGYLSRRLVFTHNRRHFARALSPRGNHNTSHTAPETMRPPIPCDVAVRIRLIVVGLLVPCRTSSRTRTGK